MNVVAVVNRHYKHLSVLCVRHEFVEVSKRRDAQVMASPFLVPEQLETFV